MTVLLYVSEPAAVVPVTSLPPCPACNGARFSSEWARSGPCRRCYGDGTDFPVSLVGETVWLVTPERNPVAEYGDDVVIRHEPPRWVGEATIAGVSERHERFGWTVLAPPEATVSWPDFRADSLPGPLPPSSDYEPGQLVVRLSGLVERDEDTLPCPNQCDRGWLFPDVPCAECGGGVDADRGVIPGTGRVAIPGGAPGEMRRWAS